MDVCAYGAIQWGGTRAAKKAEVNAALCKGDGLCCSTCPTGAIVLRHYTDQEVFNQIDAALSEAWSS
jgi:heterodisulfide reductase subunit A